MKPLISIWTSSQYPFDQRIQRIRSTMEDMGALVTVWDRRIPGYPEGRIATKHDHGPAFYFELNRQIAHLVNQHRSDLVYAADIDVMPGLMWGLRGTAENPVVLDLHEWFPEVIELVHKPLKRLFWRWVENRSVQFAHTLITVNESFQQVFEEQYDRDFTVIRNVPLLQPTHHADPDIRLNNKILYYQGALNAGRGLEVAIRTLHLLPEWKLWLVGEGDFTGDLHRIADSEGLGDRVTFYGRKLPHELSELAGQATVGLNLLENRSRSYYYSLANKYFDYIHAGLPAVHMDFPEYRKLIFEVEVGNLIGELTARAVVEAITKLVRDKDQYIRMIGLCKNARMKYHWEAESRGLVHLLEPLLQNRP
ncbi:MAG TPA: glycosyltransferase [Membranihabitans sp.]|nr:glycosyltransferase [Membranihabitans sp.]